MARAAEDAHRYALKADAVAKNAPEAAHKCIAASLELHGRLADDFQHFLRESRLALWPDSDPRLRPLSPASPGAFKPFLANPERAANALLSLIRLSASMLERHGAAFRGGRPAVARKSIDRKPTETPEQHAARLKAENDAYEAQILEVIEYAKQGLPTEDVPRKPEV